MKPSDVVLTASNLLLGTAVGAAVNQSIFVMPRWFASPPQSLREAHADSTFKAFWIPLQGATALALGAAVALRRGDRLLWGAAGLYVATWVATGVYFAPEVIRLGRADGGVSAADLRRRGRRWLALSWTRHVALAASWMLTRAALARSGAR
jgi:hypothetical protein